MLKEKEAPPLQRMLDEQGCLFVAMQFEHKIGEVVNGLFHCNGSFEDTDIAAVIVGNATESEYAGQSQRYCGSYRKQYGENFYYRVVAE